MRVIELLEGTNFDDLKFVEQQGDKKKINYDLEDDLIYYMNNNDTIYRRHLYPVIIKCVNNIKSNKPVTADIFIDAVNAGYDSYIEEYPIRELPKKLDHKTSKRICNTILKTVKDDVRDKKYDD